MLYAITDRRLYSANETQACARLLEQAAVWAANGVAYIQLREKDLSEREQVELARAMLTAIQKVSSSTSLLINGCPDVALAAEAGGVHLPSGPDALTPEEVRSIFIQAGQKEPPIISISCHSLPEVDAARKQNVDCILFAPVFEKSIREQSGEGSRILPGAGLALLEQACKLAAPVPVFALGGVTAGNAAQCIQSGAAGIAAIRLMQKAPSAWNHLGQERVEAGRRSK